MVAPLIVGAARVAGASGRVRKARKATGSASKTSKIRGRARSAYKASQATGDNQREGANNTAGRQQRNVRHILKTRRGFSQKLNKLTPNLGSGQDQIKAAAAGWTIVAFTLPFVMFTFALWLMGMLGMGMEAVPILSGLPFELLLYISYVILLITNLLFYIFAYFIFTSRGVDCTSDKKGLMLLVCIVCSMTIIINFFPYVYLWIYTVVMGQGKDSST